MSQQICLPQRVAAWAAVIYATAGTPSSLVSGSALDRQYRLSLVGLAAIDDRLAAFVLKRLDDYFEFSVSIQIKNRGNLVDIRSIGRICLIKLAGNELGLHFAGRHASQHNN